MERTPPLHSIAGVARALIVTVGVDEAVDILVSQFGWDLAFQSLAQVEGPEAAEALWRVLRVAVPDPWESVNDERYSE